MFIYGDSYAYGSEDYWRLHRQAKLRHSVKILSFKSMKLSGGKSIFSQSLALHRDFGGRYRSLPRLCGYARRFYSGGSE